MSELFCCKCATKCVKSTINGEMRDNCPNCGFIYFRNPIPGVAVVIIDDTRIALVKRVDSEKWSIPCGCIEYGEVFAHAAVREVQEEVGIECEPLKIINVVSNSWATSSSLSGIGSSIAIIILAKPLSMRLAADGIETTDARWFDLSGQLPDLDFDADRYIIGRLAEAVSSQTEISGILLSERQTSFTQI